MKTLISMTDFIMNVEIYNDYRADDFAVCYNYASFLKKPLKLEMFVPCDDDGNVLEKPKEKVFSRENGAYEFDEYCKIYEKTKEKVLFEGFEAKNYLNLVGLKHKKWDSWYMGFYKTVEDLSGQEVELTTTAIKQIGL